MVTFEDYVAGELAPYDAAEEKDGVIVEVGDCYYLKDDVDALRDEWEAEQGQVSA